MTQKNFSHWKRFHRWWVGMDYGNMIAANSPFLLYKPIIQCWLVAKQKYNIISIILNQCQIPILKSG
jgi:hypothetical protein